MGGGGSTGKVDYPDYLKDMQGIVLYGGLAGDSVPIPPDAGLNILARVMGTDGETKMTGTDANPYFGVNAFIPDSELQSAVTELNDLEAILDTANMQNQIVELETSFRDRHKFNLAQSYSRVTAVMGGSGAAMGTAFPTALAMLEVGFNNDVKDFKLKAEVEMVKNKTVAVQLRFDYLRSRIAIKVDQSRQDVGYNFDEEMWDLSVYLRAMTGIGAIAGVSTIKRDGDPSTFDSILGGLATGASIGGSVGGPQGAAIGAGVGGLLGLFS